MKRKTNIALLLLFSFLWASCGNQSGVTEFVPSTGITITPLTMSENNLADLAAQVFRIDDSLQFAYPSAFSLIQADEADEYLDIYYLNLPELSSFIEIRSYVFDSASTSSDFTNRINEQFQNNLNGQIEGTNFVPGSWESKDVIVCGIPVPFYEYQVYMDSAKENAGTKISNYFSVDTHVFSIELQLYPDEESLHKDLREDYWGIIDSVECPVIEE